MLYYVEEPTIEELLQDDLTSSIMLADRVDSVDLRRALQAVAVSIGLRQSDRDYMERRTPMGAGILFADRRIAATAG